MNRDNLLILVFVIKGSGVAYPGLDDVTVQFHDKLPSHPTQQQPPLAQSDTPQPQPSSIASLTCHEGQGERTFLIFPFPSWFCPLLSWFWSSFSTFSWLFANFSAPTPFLLAGYTTAPPASNIFFTDTLYDRDHLLVTGWLSWLPRSPLNILMVPQLSQHVTTPLPTVILLQSQNQSIPFQLSNSIATDL